MRSRWTILAIATAAQAAGGYVFLGIAALAGFVQEDLGLSGAQTGLIVTAAWLAPLFLTFAMTGNQLGIVAAPPLFGLMLDATSSYPIAWTALGAAFALAGAITLLSVSGR